MSRLRGRQGESPSGTTSEPGSQTPQGIPGRSPAPRTAELQKLLREGVRIVHCHARNTSKDWLVRARAALREVPK